MWQQTASLKHILTTRIKSEMNPRRALKMQHPDQFWYLQKQYQASFNYISSWFAPEWGFCGFLVCWLEASPAFFHKVLMDKFYRSQPIRKPERFSPLSFFKILRWPNKNCHSEVNTRRRCHLTALWKSFYLDWKKGSAKTNFHQIKGRSKKAL